MPWITPFGAHHGPSGPRGQREKVIGPLLAVCKSVATKHLGFSPKQGSHQPSVPYPPQRGLMHLSPFKRRNCQSASFRSKKIADSRGSCDVAPERTAAAASGLVGLVGASFPVQGMPRDTTGVAGRRAQASFGGRKETRHAPRPVAGQAW